MQNLIRGVRPFFITIGAVAVALGAVLLGSALLAPTEPPPSLNEGHGLAFAFGVVIAFVGLAAIALGATFGGDTKDQTDSQAAQPAAETADMKERYIFHLSIPVSELTTPSGSTSRSWGPLSGERMRSGWTSSCGGTSDARARAGGRPAAGRTREASLRRRSSVDRLGT